jgi:SNF2 family DNA or RNA helicase
MVGYSHPYQREGVLWMLTMENQTSGPKGGFLCDEMGLGKSAQLIATMLGKPQKEYSHRRTQEHYYAVGK